MPFRIGFAGAGRCLPVSSSSRRHACVATLAACAATLYFTGCRQPLPPPGPRGAPASTAKAPPLHLPASTLAIPIQDAAGAQWGGKTLLDGMSRDDLLRYRASQVKLHATLHVFPADYSPLDGERRSIWMSITPRAKWLAPVPFYVANPYRLVVLTCANHTTPLPHLCRGWDLTYRAGRFEEVVGGQQACCVMKQIYEPPYADNPGRVRIVTVNAEDAGFPWAMVDVAASENVLLDPNPRHITRAPHRQHCFFHVGRYGVNNLSPEDRAAWLTLKRPTARTRIVVKLWRTAAASTDRPDVVYDVLVDPEDCS
jgi:hypothetical protein